MPVKRQLPTYQPPNYRGMPGTTPPFIPQPIPQGGQFPQQDQVQPSLPPYMQQPGAVSQPQDQQGIMAKLKDPRFAGLLLSMGAAMGQPQQFGQTGWGQAAQAMAQGYNFLGMSQAAQEAAKRQRWEDQIRMQELAMKQQEHTVNIEDKKAGIENKKNADIFKRDEGVREGRKIDISATDTENQIQNRDANTQIKTQQMKDELAQRERMHAETMKRLDDAREARASQSEIQKLMLQEKIDNDKVVQQRESNRQAFLQKNAEIQNSIAKQRADAATTTANASATRATGTGRNNPNWAKYADSYQKTMGALEDSSPEAAGRYADAMVAQEEQYLKNTKPTGATTAKPVLRPDKKTVYIEGREILFPDEARARKYIELKSKEQK